MVDPLEEGEDTLDAALVVPAGAGSVRHACRGKNLVFFPY